MYICVHSSTLHNNQKVEIIQESISGGMDIQKWSICAMDYYSAMKRKEVLTQAATWMNLKNIIRRERSLAQRSYIE